MEQVYDKVSQKVNKFLEFAYNKNEEKANTPFGARAQGVLRRSWKKSLRENMLS